MWRALLGVAGTTGKDCFQISRGFNQPTITACTGKGKGTGSVPGIHIGFFVKV